MSGPQVFLNIIPRDTTLKTKMIGDSAFSDKSHAYKFQVQEDVLGYPISTGSWFILPESNIAANIVIKPEVGSLYDITKKFGKFSIAESEVPAKPADEPGGKEEKEEKEGVQGKDVQGDDQEKEGVQGEDVQGDDQEKEGGDEEGGDELKGEGEQMGGDPGEPEEPGKEDEAEDGGQ